MKKWLWVVIGFVVFIILIGIIYYSFIRDPNFVKCGVQNCHGPIVCGETRKNMPCTMIFAPGDRCRPLASCQVINENCQVVEQEGYKECVDCISECITSNARDENDSCYDWCK